MLPAVVMLQQATFQFMAATVRLFHLLHRPLSKVLFLVLYDSSFFVQATEPLYPVCVEGAVPQRGTVTPCMGLAGWRLAFTRNLCNAY